QAVVEAVEATCGRATMRIGAESQLLECARVADVAALYEALAAAERQALLDAIAVSVTLGDGTSALAALIARAGEEAALHGLVAVARRGAPFAAEERELLASLAR